MKENSHQHQRIFPEHKAATGKHRKIFSKHCKKIYKASKNSTIGHSSKKTNTHKAKTRFSHYVFGQNMDISLFLYRGKQISKIAPIKHRLHTKIQLQYNKFDRF